MDFPLLLPPPRTSLLQALRPWLPTIITSLLVISLLIHLLWPTSSLEQSVREVQRWPQLPSAHFSLARALAQNGYEALAQQEADIGKQQLTRLDLFLLGRLFQNDWQATKTTVHQKQALEEKLKEIDQLVSVYPYSWQLLIQQAVLRYRLYEDTTAQESLEKAFWLNPGNKLVEVVRSKVTAE